MYVLSMLSRFVLPLPVLQSTACMVCVNEMIFLIHHISGSLLRCVYLTCLYHDENENSIYCAALVVTIIFSDQHQRSTVVSKLITVQLYNSKSSKRLKNMQVSNILRIFPDTHLTQAAQNTYLICSCTSITEI